MSQWNNLFGCVRVDHGYMENLYLPHLLIRFSQVRPKGEFRGIAEEPSYIQVMPEKSVIYLIRILDLYPPPSTLVWTCGRNPSRIMRDFDAPKPRFSETLAY